MYVLFDLQNSDCGLPVCEYILEQMALQEEAE